MLNKVKHPTAKRLMGIGLTAFNAKRRAEMRSGDSENYPDNAACENSLPEYQN